MTKDGQLGELGTRLAEARHHRGVTQRALAECTGTTQRHVAHVEGGRVNPSVEFLVAAADALRTDVGFLLTGKRESGRVLEAWGRRPVVVDALTRVLRSADSSPEERAAVLDTLRDMSCLTQEGPLGRVMEILCETPDRFLPWEKVGRRLEARLWEAVFADSGLGTIVLPGVVELLQNRGLPREIRLGMANVLMVCASDRRVQERFVWPVLRGIPEDADTDVAIRLACLVAFGLARQGTHTAEIVAYTRDFSKRESFPMLLRRQAIENLRRLTETTGAEAAVQALVHLVRSDGLEADLRRYACSQLAIVVRWKGSRSAVCELIALVADADLPDDLHGRAIEELAALPPGPLQNLAADALADLLTRRPDDEAAGDPTLVHRVIVRLRELGAAGAQSERPASAQRRLRALAALASLTR